MTAEPLSGRVVVGIRACLALVLGLVGFFMVVLAVLMPATTAILVVGFFAGYALLDGALVLVAAGWAVQRVLPRVLMLLEGLVDVATSVTAFILVQGERPRGILALIAAWAIVTGVLQLGWTFSVDLQRGRPDLALAGALSVAFGLWLLGWRPPDLLTAVGRLAVYAVVLGVLGLLAAFRLQGPSRLAA
jgi:uncharacterized membrane protein HdeD (DUF308 family)